MAASRILTIVLVILLVKGQNPGVGMEGLEDVGMEGLHKSHLPKRELLTANSAPPAALPLVGLPRSLAGVE
jgi:hypothetical protein